MQRLSAMTTIRSSRLPIEHGADCCTDSDESKGWKTSVGDRGLKEGHSNVQLAFKDAVQHAHHLVTITCMNGTKDNGEER